MRKLVIIRGNSGSGKSSAARALQRQIGPNTLLISQDIVRREMLRVHDGIDTAAIPLLMALMEYGYSNCQMTIMEGILNATWYKPVFDKAIELFHEDNIHAYYYDLSFEETLKRHDTKKNKLDFDADDMRRWWNEKDYIGSISEKSWNEDITVDEAVKMIMSDLQM